MTPSKDAVSEVLESVVLSGSKEAISGLITSYKVAFGDNVIIEANEGFLKSLWKTGSLNEDIRTVRGMTAFAYSQNKIIQTLEHGSPNHQARYDAINTFVKLEEDYFKEGLLSDALNALSQRNEKSTHESAFMLLICGSRILLDAFCERHAISEIKLGDLSYFSSTGKILLNDFDFKAEFRKVDHAEFIRTLEYSSKYNVNKVFDVNLDDIDGVVKSSIAKISMRAGNDPQNTRSEGRVPTLRNGKLENPELYIALSNLLSRYKPIGEMFNHCPLYIKEPDARNMGSVYMEMNRSSRVGLVDVFEFAPAEKKVLENISRETGDILRSGFKLSKMMANFVSANDIIGDFCPEGFGLSLLSLEQVSDFEVGSFSEEEVERIEKSIISWIDLRSYESFHFLKDPQIRSNANISISGVLSNSSSRDANIIISAINNGVSEKTKSFIRSMCRSISDGTDAVSPLEYYILTILEPDNELASRINKVYFGSNSDDQMIEDLERLDRIGFNYAAHTVSANPLGKSTQLEFIKRGVWPERFDPKFLDMDGALKVLARKGTIKNDSEEIMYINAYGLDKALSAVKTESQFSKLCLYYGDDVVRECARKHNVLNKFTKKTIITNDFEI